MKKQIVAWVGVLIFISAQVSFAQSYSVTSFGDAWIDRPRALNNEGQIAGYNMAEEGRAFLRGKDGSRINLDAVLEGKPWMASESMAEGLNDAGSVVGRSYAINSVTGFPDSSRALLWQEGDVFDLGALPGYTSATAKSINNNGQVIGVSNNLDSVGLPMDSEAFFWNQGQMTSLGFLSGGDWSAPAAINDKGQVVGTSSSASSQIRAFSWSNPTDGMTELGSLGNGPGTSMAWDVNINGQVVGISNPNGDYLINAGTKAVLWSNGETIELGGLPGSTWAEARAINDSGWIVGNDSEKAVLWNPDGSILDLNTLLPSDSEWDLYNACDINNEGKILAFGMKNGSLLPEYVLLTPVAVPELSTFWQMVLAAGVVGLVYLRSNSKRFARPAK